jgi:putative ABC transport system permease protein
VAWWRLWPLSVAEWRHHAWRHAVALLAVALGVALASSVQMINASALSEFSQAVRSVNGEPDAVLAATHRDGLADTLYGTLATDPAVTTASPVLELDAPARRTADGRSVALRLVGVDALKVAAVAPSLLPRPGPSGAAADAPASGAGSAPRTLGLQDLLAPDGLYLNTAAQQLLAVSTGQTVELATAQGWQPFRVMGQVAAGGAALAVLDIAAAQTRFGRTGRLTRIDLRLAPGTDRRSWQAQLRWPGALPPGTLPAGARWAEADDAVQRVSNLSRAYRVNLGVLALVAMLVGGFLVYSVVSLSVAQRTPQLALLGVLGLAARDRRALVLAESAVVGSVGSALGLGAGAGLAALALRLLGGDLGGGYFSGVAPTLQWPVGALIACFGLGTLAAVLGSWWPARQAESLAPAQALKGLGSPAAHRAPASSWHAWWPGLGLLALGGLLALAPAVDGLPLAAYAAVGLLLAGGVLLVPAMVQWLVAAGVHPRRPVALLAWRRARFARHTAQAAVAGVVASLALSVAITVMVASFRAAVTDWLDTVLPADLYVRSPGSSVLPADLPARAATLPGVLRLEPGRQVPLQVAPRQPAVMLTARPLGDDAARRLPLVSAVQPAVAGELSAWISEPAAAIHGWQAGQRLVLPLPLAGGGQLTVRVRGVWRDYARQAGAVAIDLADYQRATGDTQVNDLALWLAPGTALADVDKALKALVSDRTALETIGTQALRQVSLAIFDRSFAVTVYLQAVAIAVGLVGVAASLSAQVLARRKEFGLLRHLGLTRRQVMALVTGETAAWLAAGVLVGLALGLLMALVLVHVVNPQSFHWTMPLQVPVARLAALAGAVLVAGLVTAAFSARRAAGRDAVQAVKEDW